MPNNFTKVNWLKGVNLIDAPNMLRDGEVQLTRNMVPYGPRGLLVSRPNAAYDNWIVGSAVAYGNLPLVTPVPLSHGYKTLYPTLSSIGDLSFHTCGFIQDPSLNPYVIALAAQGISGNFPIYYTGQGVNGPWRKGPLTQMPICVDYLGKQLWFSNSRGTTGVGINTSESYAALALSVSGGNQYADFRRENLAGANNSNVKPAGACKYRERLVLWGLGPGLEDYIAYTDNGSMVVGPDLLDTATGRNYQVGSDGVPIVSCVEVMLSGAGTPAQSALLVLKQTGAYLVTSEPNQSDETTYFTGNPPMQTIQFNVDATCISHHSVVRTPYGVIWCGVDDVWAFVNNMVPFRIGTKLNPVIRACAIGGYGWRTSAEFYAGAYRLQLPSLPYVGNTVGSLFDGFEQYWLELRNGLPQNFEEAAWFGPQVYGGGFGFGSLAAETRPERPRYLYTLKSTAYQSSGTKYVINSVLLDANRSGQDVFDAAADVPLYLRNYNYPVATLVTPDYDFEDAMTDKVYTGTEIALRTSHSLPLLVAATMNGGMDYGTNVDILVKNAANSYVTSLAYPPDSQRPIGTDISLEVSQLGGFVIEEAVNDHVHFLEESGPSKQAKIAAGRYSNLDALLDAICAAMTQKSHNNRTYTHNQNSTPRTNQYVTITASGGTWAFVNQLTDPISTALLALIGFTQAQGSYTPAISQTAVTEVGTAPAYPFDLDSVILRTFTIPRRPAV